MRGSTPRGRSAARAGRDHPRMRGEHWDLELVSNGKQGSSPHARGAHGARGLPPRRAGIIPACAGSTTRHPQARCRCRDHPRMRGEHLVRDGEDVIASGSSPHARGALRLALLLGEHGGIIPACAGSTHELRRTSVRGRDHPRMRGEHMSSSCTCVPVPGSSPHARGAHLQRGNLQRTRGIIPACAGSTPGGWASSRPPRDHPRMRGEHSVIRWVRTDMVGSSPHARGARARR